VRPSKPERLKRYAGLGLSGVATNAACPAPVLEEVARPDRDGLALVRDAADAMRLSARGFHRVLKLARTLADPDGEENVRRLHLAEALSYRAHTDRRQAAA
jgi:magnesium chelatase family protein